MLAAQLCTLQMIVLSVSQENKALYQIQSQIKIDYIVAGLAKQVFV